MKNGVEDVNHVLNGEWGKNSEYDLSYTMAQRRILITHLASLAQKNMKKSTIMSSFRRTGCAMTANGDDDEYISPQTASADYINRFHLAFGIALSKHTAKREAALKAAAEGKVVENENVDSAMLDKKFLLWAKKRYHIVHVLRVLQFQKDGKVCENVECHFYGTEDNSLITKRDQKIFPQWLNQNNETLCCKVTPVNCQPHVQLHSTDDLFTYFGALKEVKIENDCVVDDYLLFQLNPKAFVNPRGRTGMLDVDGPQESQNVESRKLKDMINVLIDTKEKIAENVSIERAVVQLQHNMWILEPELDVIEAPPAHDSSLGVFIPPSENFLALQPPLPSLQAVPLVVPTVDAIFEPINVPVITDDMLSYGDSNFKNDERTLIDGLLLPDISDLLTEEAVKNSTTRSGRNIRRANKYTGFYI